ncbi:UNVERIFIED_CONTAM: hypothetical protein HDU68_008771 [Siphonaria sp. JEL0065]|nr:hypothetical protein HDU68_008771 [Siphonaria sp. JEL0065]
MDEFVNESISAQSNKKAVKKIKKLLSQPQASESQQTEIVSDWVDDEEGGGPAIRDAGLAWLEHQRPDLVEKRASAMSLDTLPRTNSTNEDTKMIPASDATNEKKEKQTWVKQPKQPKNAPKDDLLSLILEVEGTRTVNGNKWEVKLVHATFEQDTFDLYTKYQINVHKDPPTKIEKSGFTGFLVDSPLTFIPPSEIVLLPNSSDKSLGEFPGYGSFHQKYYLNGQLIAVSVLDILPACVSAVYFMYDPTNPIVRNLSMGVYSGLRETAMAKQYSRILPGLKYLYMGFYIHSCSKMRYKAQFKPSDLICPKTRVWVPVEKCVKLLDVHKVALLSAALKLEDNGIPDPSDLSVFGPSAITHEYHVDIKDLANIMIYQDGGVTLLKMLAPNRKVLEDIGQFVKLVGINVAKQLILFSHKKNFTKMGIPKFFRWISERYPLCSHLVQENKIPVFDNLYLDMNGIIHPCSHPNDDNPHFRITEEQIFLAIFNYIDALFAKIKPTKLFFMAVDGVAPRAKMNQQRSRRFRTAKDAEDARKKALMKGEELPKDKAFDSNCITPGTPFMARLSENLKYFISKKISEDAAWANITVVLSGHDVPGEGEHKIMEYIRSFRASPDYVPNTRHCLYGLDADLIMLGLLSHEPHFALLREEVTFGGRGQNNKKTLATSNPDSQNFFLMHLSIFREYLDLEFQSMKDSLVGFEYSPERVIDDFILLSFFVGNDFLPHLPGLHINEGALATFFKIYKEKLPGMGGYINEDGEINLPRLEILLLGIGQMENEVFLIERGDSRYVEGKSDGGHQQLQPKQGGKGKRRGKKGQQLPDEVTSPVSVGSPSMEGAKRKSILYLSHEHKAYYDQIRNFIMSPRGSSGLFFPPFISPEDRTFIINLSKELGLRHGVGFDPSEELPASQQLQKLFVSWEGDDLDDESDEESNEARMRIVKRYDFAEILDGVELDAMKEEEGQVEIEKEFVMWKADYYREKLEINYWDEEQLSKIVYHYIEGLQWVLLYYYRGVPSWEWFFPYHYAPKITDLCNIVRFHPIKFDKGKPFLPFYQLMGVMPAASKELLPPAFRDLMTDAGSPIIDFYPTEFALDLNGKKQDWEAVVKIPFIDEVRLIRALTARSSQLTEDEKKRNSLGHAYKFQKNPDPKAPAFHFTSPSQTFPDIPKCSALSIVYDIPSEVEFKFGLLPGNQSCFHPGFPSLNTLPHTATLGYHGVTVFQQESQRESMIVTLTAALHAQTQPIEAIALRLLKQKRVFIGWPFLTEALVVKVSDEVMTYRASKGVGGEVKDARDVSAEPMTDFSQDKFYDSVEKSEAVYSKRFGTIIGPVEVIVTVRPLRGMTLADDGSMVKDFGGEEASPYTDYALQTVVEGSQHEDPRYVELPPPAIGDEFYIASSVFFLGPINYGCLAGVQGYNETGELMTVKFVNPLSQKVEEALKFTRDIAQLSERDEKYTAAFQVCKNLRISSFALSKLTASFFVTMTNGKSRNGGDERANFGLNMKFEGKGKKVLGMTQKNAGSWEYSNKAIALIREYIEKFPEVIRGIDRSRGGDMFADVDFFPQETLVQRINDLKVWIKAIGVKDFEKVSLDAQALTKPYVTKIEQTVDAIYADAGAELYQKSRIIKNIPRNAVLKPAHAPFRCGAQTFELGERVVNVAATGVVPLGALGTVVGIEGGRVVDIVFDLVFMSGVSLEGRCSPNRGMSVYKDTLLNISRPQPLKGTTATASAIQTRSNVPDRIPGKPLLNPQERQRHANLESALSSTKKSNQLNPKGLVSTNVDIGSGSSASAVRSAWTEGGSGAVKAHQPVVAKVPKKAAASDVKQQHGQILEGIAQQSQQQNGHKKQHDVEVDQMTKNLKSLLSIGGDTGAASQPSTQPSTQSVPTPVPAPQAAPGQQSQDISHQILSMMSSTAPPPMRPQLYQPPYHGPGGYAPPRNELEQLVSGGGGYRPQFYPNQPPQYSFNPNYGPPQGYYFPNGGFGPHTGFVNVPPPPHGFVPPGPQGFCPPQNQQYPQQTQQQQFQPLQQQQQQQQQFRPLQSGDQGGGGYYNPQQNGGGRGGRGGGRSGRGGRGGRGGGRGGRGGHQDGTPKQTGGSESAATS